MTESISHRSPELMCPETSLLLVMDVQERLLPHIAQREDIAGRSARLLRAADLFEVPLCVTEQYPRGLGATVPALADACPLAPREKTRFSAAEATGWPMAAQRGDARDQVVLAGIETHICVVQTALDLVSWGYRLYVVADAIGSQRPADHEIALGRMRDAGITITTSESVLFEWCEEAGTDRFRAMRKLL